MTKRVETERPAAAGELRDGETECKKGEIAKHFVSLSLSLFSASIVAAILFISPEVAAESAGSTNLRVVNPLTESGAATFDSINPITVLEEAGDAVPGFEGGLSTTLNILLLLTVLALAPSILLLATCFTRIVITLGLLRQALGTQGLPPSQVIVGLSLFVTMVVMAPTMQRMWREGIEPYVSGNQPDPAVAWDRSKQPLRDFMFAQIEASGNWSGVYLILNYRGIDTSDPASLDRSDVDMLTLIPAFVLSELKIAFLIGFRVYLPFLVIDMVIASLLVSMGMLMLPPVLISLPFKLLLFVLVDGWQLVVGTLMTSVAQPDETMQLASMALNGGP